MITERERSDIHEQRAALEKRLKRMERLIDDATLENRDLTPKEDHEYRELQAEVEKFEVMIRRGQQRREERDREGDNEPTYRRSTGLPEASRGIGAAIVQAGFDLRSNPGVTIPLAELRASDFASPGDWAPTRLEGIEPLGRDSRFLWTALGTTEATGTSIEDWRQTARTVTGNVEVSLAGGDTKAKMEVGLELVNDPLKFLAVIIEDVPTALTMPLNAQAFIDWLNTEAAGVLHAALDAHLLSQIAAANPSKSQTGTDLIAQVRNAVAAMRANGMNPDVLALSGTDAATLDLSTDDGGYIFPTRASGSASPLWNLRVFEVADPASGPITPHLIDSRRWGVTYMGTIQTLADPYSKLDTNLVDIRFEMAALSHVRNSNAIHIIDTPGDGDGDGDGDA